MRARLLLAALGGATTLLLGVLLSSPSSAERAVSAASVASGDDDIRELELPLAGPGGRPLLDACGRPVIVSGAELLDALAQYESEPPRDDSLSAALDRVEEQAFTATLEELGLSEQELETMARTGDPRLAATYSANYEAGLQSAGIDVSEQLHIERQMQDSITATDVVFAELTREQETQSPCPDVPAGP